MLELFRVWATTTRLDCAESGEGAGKRLTAAAVAWPGYAEFGVGYLPGRAERICSALERGEFGRERLVAMPSRAKEDKSTWREYRLLAGGVGMVGRPELMNRGEPEEGTY